MQQMVVKEMTSPRANYKDWIGSEWTSIFHWTMWIAATLTIHRRLATWFDSSAMCLANWLRTQSRAALEVLFQVLNSFGDLRRRVFLHQLFSFEEPLTGQTTIDQDLNPFLCYGGANWHRSRRRPTFEVLNFFGDLKWRVLFAFVVRVRGATGEKAILGPGSIPLQMVVQSATNWLRSRRRPSFEVLFQILKFFVTWDEEFYSHSWFQFEGPLARRQIDQDLDPA